MSDAWAYIVAAYCVAGVGLGALAIAAFLNLRANAKRARQDEAP